MEAKTTTKNRKSIIPAAATFSSPEAAGWLFKIIHEGWLRKRWRKRYCVLSNGILYFYEFKTSDGSEKTCSTMNLSLFRECVKAPQKDCKKNPNTIILEPANAKDKKASSAKQQMQREYFYTETPEEQEKWVAKLQEALSLSSIGGNQKLQHVTKNRAKPPVRANGNRRPPSKQHIREMAMMAEVSLDEDLTQTSKENGAPKKRGHKPASALKPPPGGGNARLSPKSPKKASSSNESPQSTEDNETDGMTPSSSPLPLTPKSPTPPPAALKPNSVKKSNSKGIPSTLSEDSNVNSVSMSSLTEDEDPKMEDTPKSPPAPPAALKPKSTKRSPDSDNVDKDLPLPPPAPGSPEDPNFVINSTPVIAEEDPKSPPPPPATLEPSTEKKCESPFITVERTQSADSMGNQPSPPATPDEEQTRSLSSSRGSSLGKGDEIAVKHVSVSESPPGTSQSQSESDKDVATTPPDTNEDGKNVEEIKGISTDERMVKAKSMMELDKDLPPPPPDPPTEEQNGDALKADVKPNKQKNKKAKKEKKDKKVRPSSLVLEI